MNAPNLIVDESDAVGDYVRFRVMVAQNDANEEQGAGSFYKMASLRLECAQSLGAGLYLIDVKQVPNGCPAWPSFWLLGFPDLDWKWQGIGANNRWPNFGEIDIVEQWGVHGSNNFNATTCHTSPGCFAHFEPRSSRNFQIAHPPGNYDATSHADCNWMSGGAGCQQQLFSQFPSWSIPPPPLPSPTPDAVDFTQGIYVCEVFFADHGTGFVRVWFLPESDQSTLKLRKRIRSNASIGSLLSTADLKAAHLHTSFDRCNPSFFRNLRMVLNTAFCGDGCRNNISSCDDGNVSWSPDPAGDPCKAALDAFFQNKLNLTGSDAGPLFSGSESSAGQILDKFEWKVRSIRYYEPNSATNAPSWWSQDFGQITRSLQTYAYLGIWILVLCAAIFLAILVTKRSKSRRALYSLA
jgi:hypothetical protein